MKIIVLAGGLSPERDVSLSSGALIANALLENGHRVMLLDAYLGIHSPDFPPIYKTVETAAKFSYAVPIREPDLCALRAQAGNKASLLGEGVLPLCAEADLIFLALHGGIGENGQLQAVFDVHGIRYTGTGYIGSLLAMDKDISKRLLREANIPTPDWQRIDTANAAAIGRIIGEESEFKPFVIKPCSCGSSVGVTIVESPEAAQAALELAMQYENSLLIEDKIEGREFSVGILGGEALPVIEICPVSGFYDYAHKYQPGATAEICPAEIPEAVRALLQANALAVHKALHLGDYSRVDFMLDSQNRAYCLEANTLPGMTPTSLLPQEALAAGISYRALCEKIAQAGFGG